jgi:hypothetical protein
MDGERPGEEIVSYEWANVAEGNGHTSMHTEYLVVDDHAQREEIKHICKIVPNIGIPVLPRTFGIESIRLRNPSRFMVPSNQMHSVGVSELQTNKKRNSFNTEHASIHIVAC